MSTGEDRDVTRECEIKCRQFPDYHCFDTCKRAPLDETYDGEFAHSMYLLRKRLGMLTMLERWGLGCLKYVLDWALGAFCFHLLAGTLYYTYEDMAHAGTPETVQSGLLWGGHFCVVVGLVFYCLAARRFLINIAEI